MERVLAREHGRSSDLMRSTAGGIVSRVVVGLCPLAGLNPPPVSLRRDGGWAPAVKRLPQLSRPLWKMQSCTLCSGLIHELQMGDVSGPTAPCHLVNGFVSDAGQFEAQQTAHHVIA